MSVIEDCFQLTPLQSANLFALRGLKDSALLQSCSSGFSNNEIASLFNLEGSVFTTG